MHHFPFFRLFLVVYLVLLLVQATTLPLFDIPILLALLSGAGVAVIAHQRHGPIMIGFLLLHICLEWSMGAHTHILFILHTGFDLIFLWTELGIHMKKYRRTIFVATILGMVLASFSSESHTHEETALEHVLILGGMLTCTVIHAVRGFQPKKLSLKQ